MEQNNLNKVNSLKQIRKIKIDSSYQQTLNHNFIIHRLCITSPNRTKTFNIPTASKSVDVPNTIQGNYPGVYT